MCVKAALCVWLITMLLACTNCLEILEPLGTLQAFTALALFLFVHIKSLFTSYDV